MAAQEYRVKYKNMSAGALVKGGPGRYWGFQINSTSSGTLKIFDSLTAAGTVVNNTITPAIGLYQFNIGVEFTTGLYIDVPSGSIDITVFYA